MNELFFQCHHLKFQQIVTLMPLTSLDVSLHPATGFVREVDHHRAELDHPQRRLRDQVQVHRRHLRSPQQLHQENSLPVRISRRMLTFAKFLFSTIDFKLYWIINVPGLEFRSHHRSAYAPSRISAPIINQCLSKWVPTSGGNSSCRHKIRD